MKKRTIALFVCFSASVFATPTIEDFVRHEQFDDIKISPSGEFIAATVPNGKGRVLSILNLKTFKGLAVGGSKSDYVADFYWVNDHRIVYQLGEKIIGLTRPIGTGELFGVDAEGKNFKYLFGYRAPESTGSHVNSVKLEFASASIINTLADDDDHILIQTRAWDSADGTVAEIWSLNVNTGFRERAARSAPVGAGVYADGNGHPWLAATQNRSGLGVDLYRYNDDKNEWTLLMDRSKSKASILPLSVSADGKSMVAQVTGAEGPDAVSTINLDTFKHDVIARHEFVDPYRIHFSHDKSKQFLAVSYDGDKPELDVYAEDHVEAQLLRSLAQTFKGQHVAITSATGDQKKFVIQAWSDKNPGEFFLYDTASHKLASLAQERSWLKPEEMPARQSIHLKARDGLPLHGFLTLPINEKKNLPMVVLPHGGPFEVRDDSSFDTEAAILATNGYAVLQVNFRGSGGYGETFVTKGYQHWGREMQDDVTDATKWAISEGYADAKRICIFGTSYGGYAALMGVVREPELYQCAIGHAGVYDLALMHSRGDIKRSSKGRAFLDNAVGDDDEDMASRSPLTHAAEIKRPIMLIAGGMDERVPAEHAKRMKAALEKAGNKPEWLFKQSEAHGFFDEKNRLEMYTKILAFLQLHIGKKTS
jgi:dipeptidyl aminopeptidase/acylaminoacyl peptidase